MARRVIWGASDHEAAAWIAQRLGDLESATQGRSLNYYSAREAEKGSPSYQWDIVLEPRMGMPEPRPKYLERLQAWCEALYASWQYLQRNKAE